MHDDSSKKARLQRVQILETETHLLPSTNYTSERRLDKAGEGEREGRKREDCCWGWRVASYL